MVIEDRVWSVARERLGNEGGEWSLQMHFAPDDGDVERALTALRAAVRKVGAEYDESLAPDGSDPPFFGEWEVTRLASGVLLYVTECEVFEVALLAIATGAARRGVSGSLSVWEPPPAFRAPPRAPLLACRITVRGERVRTESGGYLWEPDEDAHAAVVEAAASWCRWDGEAEVAAISVSLSGPVALAPDDPGAARLLEASRRGSGATQLAARAGEQFRTISVPAYTGRVTLAVGQLDPPPGWWTDPLRELVALLRTDAEGIAYAHVRTGWNVDQALQSDGLGTDWPARPHHEPWGRVRTRIAFDDVLAPDAFGVQLLGPGYAGRFTPSERWRTAPHDGGGTLLEATDLEPWFAGPIVPGAPVGAAADPRVLESARQELDPILCSPATLRALGYPGVIAPSAQHDRGRERP